MFLRHFYEHFALFNLLGSGTIKIPNVYTNYLLKKSLEECQKRKEKKPRKLYFLKSR